MNRGDLTLEEASRRSKRLPRPARRRVRGDARRRRRSRASRTSPSRARPRRQPRRHRRHRGDRRARRRSSTRSSTLPDGFTCTRSSSGILGSRRTEFDARPRSTGRSPRRSRSARCCSKARRCGSPARTRGGARSASATACSSTTTTEREYVPLAHLGRRPGAVHALRHRALGVRRARLRVRLLDRRSRRARVLGSAVRRLRQRRADRSSTSSSSPPRTSGASAAASCCSSPTASKARARSTRARARALPRAVRRGQPARRLPDHRRAVLPRAAPPGASPAQRKPLVVLHAEALPAHAARRARRVAAFTDGALRSSCSTTAPSSTATPSTACSCAPASSATS